MVQSCAKCKIGTNTAVDAGSLWCTGCGEQIVAQCEWTFSYSNRNNNYRRVPVYSRLKRFREWCIKTRIPYVLQHMSSILDLYAKLEFGWINNKKKTMLFFQQELYSIFLCNRPGYHLTDAHNQNSQRRGACGRTALRNV